MKGADKKDKKMTKDLKGRNRQGIHEEKIQDKSTEKDNRGQVKDEYNRDLSKCAKLAQ